MKVSVTRPQLPGKLQTHIGLESAFSLLKRPFVDVYFPSSIGVRCLNVHPTRAKESAQRAKLPSSYIVAMISMNLRHECKINSQKHRAWEADASIQSPESSSTLLKRSSLMAGARHTRSRS